jgi:hypothetical protein
MCCLTGAQAPGEGLRELPKSFGVNTTSVVPGGVMGPPVALSQSDTG